MSLGSRSFPLLALGNVLAGMLLVPLARPLLATRYPGVDAALHAFFGVNMLGGALGAPLVSWLADRRGGHRTLALGLSVADAALLAACLLPLPLGVLLSLRALQGAASVGALSIVMGMARGHAQGTHGGVMGRMAAAVVAGIALGAPLGTLLLAGGPAMGLAAASLVALAVAAGLARLPDLDVSPAPRAGAVAVLRQVRVPALFVGAERFAVGCFVTTFSLYAHQSLGFSDREVGLGFTVFLACFALASWGVGAAAARVPPAAFLGAGAGTFGLGFVALGFVPAALTWPVLALTGLASGCIYTPSLCLAAQPVSSAQRSTAMGLINATGTLGMMAGTAVAGVLGAALLRSGWTRAEASAAVFCVAGLAQGVVLGAAASTLLGALASSQGRQPQA